MIATLVLLLRLILAIALYAFLGWALWNLLREFKQQGDRLATQKKPAYHIIHQDRAGSGKQTTILTASDHDRARHKM